MNPKTKEQETVDRLIAAIRGIDDTLTLALMLFTICWAVSFVFFVWSWHR